MGSIKDRNGMNLTEAEDIKKRWQEYTEELHKKDLHDPEPTVAGLLCQVNWARWYHNIRPNIILNAPVSVFLDKINV